ncbi:hypothetical protein P261_01645 [Lachnospiraceae bacterium TWA4]|nr:hypothetical protein P261_01645 [Lachnospiraceae bacterium TWA4]
MQMLAQSLCGKDLQLLHELRQAIVNPATGVSILQKEGNSLYQMPDKTIWSFDESEVITESNQKYIQITATDVTKLYHLQEELNEQNKELTEMIEQVKRITQNVAEVTRQQEILTAKMRVHNKMGNCLLAARQYLVQDFPKHKKQPLIDLWKDSLEVLSGEIHAEDEEDAFSAVVNIAKTMGVDVKVFGKQPSDEKTAYMLVVALRECVTNTIRHAQGNEIFVEITESLGKVGAIYTNNGKVPQKEIVEGGGLTSLRQKIEAIGGIMTVSSFPKFSLTIELPEHSSNQLE